MGCMLAVLLLLCTRVTHSPVLVAHRCLALEIIIHPRTPFLCPAVSRLEPLLRESNTHLLDLNPYMFHLI